MLYQRNLQVKHLYENGGGDYIKIESEEEKSTVKKKRKLNNARDKKIPVQKETETPKKILKIKLDFKEGEEDTTKPRLKRKQVKFSTDKDSPKDKYMTPTDYIDPYDYFDSSFESHTVNGEERIDLRPKLPRECKPN